MRRLIMIPAAALPLLLTIACNSSGNKKEALFERNADVTSAAADTSAIIAPDKQDEQTPSPNGTPSVKAAPNNSAPVANPDWDKKIVKTADLSIETNNFQTFTHRLHNTVKQLGGYIAQEQQTQSLSSIENTVSIKVPVAAFDDLVQSLAADSDRLVEKRISSEDVTGKIVDTRSRLETKKEVRERYLDLLKQAKNMKDILAVQQDINNIQEEMDAAAGQIAWMGHSAAFSTVNLRFYQTLDAGVKEDPSQGFFKRLKEAISEGGAWAGLLILGLVSVWPLWLAIGLLWFVLRKRVFKGHRKMPAAEA